jgi:hypothetical protein
VIVTTGTKPSEIETELNLLFAFPVTVASFLALMVLIPMVSAGAITQRNLAVFLLCLFTAAALFWLAPHRKGVLGGIIAICLLRIAIAAILSPGYVTIALTILLSLALFWILKSG